MSERDPDVATARAALAEHDRIMHGRGMTDCEWVVRNDYFRLRNPAGIARCEEAIKLRAALAEAVK